MMGISAAFVGPRVASRVLAISCVLALAGCPSAPPTLELSAGALRVGGEARVSVTAVDGVEPGQGQVTVSTSLGALDAEALTLVDGSARTTLRCPRGTPGCVAGAVLTVTARWPRSSGALTAMAQVTLTDPPTLPGDAGTPDSGSPDGGADGGGVADGGADAGPRDAGLVLDLGSVDVSGATALPVSQGAVLGYFTPTRTIGLALFGDSGVTQTGFNAFPDQPLLFIDRLVYLRGGKLYGWVEDFADASVSDPDAGTDAGLYPLFAPEANDVVIPLGCEDVVGLADSGVGVRIARSARDVLWVQCQAQLDGGSPFFRPVGGRLFGGFSGGSLLSAGAFGVLVGGADGGLSFETARFPVSPVAPPIRQYDFRAARAVGDDTFELLSFDPNANRCHLMRAQVAPDFGQLLLEERPIESNLPRSRQCLTWRFVDRTDKLASIDLSEGVIALPFLRLLPDGGAPGDAGAGRDGGGALDAGVGEVLLAPGLPTDLTLEPPRLSIDFRDPRGAVLLTR